MNKEKSEIELIYKEYGAMVFGRCRQILKDEDRAYDALQDVFARLLTFRGDVEFPSTFLYRTATNVCLNILRKEKNERSDLIDQEVYEIASQEDIEKNYFLKEKIVQLFSGEKKSTRTISFMRHIDKMSLAEIADEMGMSVSGIKKRLKKIQDKYRSMEFHHE